MSNKFELDKEIEEAIKSGPTFGQSRFQSSNFVIQKHGTDGRSYRQILLELNNKYNSLKKCEISTKRIKTQMTILNNKIEKESDFNEKELLRCDLEDKALDLRQQEKLVMDAIDDCNYLYACFKSIPHISSEEFELQEKEYWNKRLMLDAELSVLSTGRIDIGTAMSLVNIGHNPLQIQTDIAIQQNNAIIQLEKQHNLLIEEKK